MLRKLTLALLLAASPAAAQVTSPPTAAQALVNATIQQNATHNTSSQAMHDALTATLAIFPTMGTWDTFGNYTPKISGNLPLSAFTIGASQNAQNQLGQITAPYTAAQLNVRQDVFRVQVGDCDLTREFQNQPAGPSPTAYTTAAILGCTTTPAGSSTSPATWPDMGVAGVANTYNAGKSAIGLFGLAGVGVDNALAQGLNLVVSNTPTGALASDGNGHNVAALNAAETDMNIFKTSAGLGPTGVFQGITSYISGTVQPAAGSQVDAFAAISSNNPVSGSPIPQWVNAYASRTGMAQVALYAGATTYSIPSNSQAISLNMGTANAVPLNDLIYGQSDGSLVATTQGAGGGTSISVTGKFTVGPDGSLYLAGGNYPAANTPIATIRTGINGGAVFQGVTSQGGLVATTLPSAAVSGTTKGTACVDSAGNFYVKTTTGACL